MKQPNDAPTKNARRIVIARSKYGGEYVFDDGEWIRKAGDYTILSEPAEVAFTMLPTGDVVANQLAALDRQEGALRDKFSAELSKIDDERQSLRALEAPAPAPEG